MSDRQVVYKITSQQEWDAALAANHYPGAAIDLADGFIHFSTAEQAAETAEKHFRGQTDLLLVAVETEAYGDAMKWEVSRGGALFPHLYGPFDRGSVIWTRPIETNADGVPVVTFPETNS